MPQLIHSFSFESFSLFSRKKNCNNNYDDDSSLVKTQHEEQLKMHCMLLHYLYRPTLADGLVIYAKLE